MKLDRHEAERQADAIIAAARSQSKKHDAALPATGPARRVPFAAALRALILTAVLSLVFLRIAFFRDAPAVAVLAAVLLVAVFELTLLVNGLRHDVALLRAELGDMQRHIRG